VRRSMNVGRGYPPRLLIFVLATALVGGTLVAGAALRGLSAIPSTGTAVGVAVFFLLAVAAEMRPVPIDAEGQRLVSLAFVFVVASQPLFGWEWSVLIGAAAIAVAMMPLRVGILKPAFNSAVYAISAALASLPNFIGHAESLDGRYAVLTGIAFASGAIFVFTNVVLVCSATALAAGERVRDILADHLRRSGLMFSIMAFIVAQVVIFWQLSPLLLILAGAPLFAVNLYQRSVVRGRVALKAASTDSLTGLKNHRAYHEEVAVTFDPETDRQDPVTLCLIDVDRFKQVNDRYGHPAGDAVLKMLGSLIEELAPGRGYRLGGDEFALLLEDDQDAALQLVGQLQQQFAEARLAEVQEDVTISSGIASFPEHARDAALLKKRADLALYRSKHNGKNCARVFEGDADDEDTVGPVLHDPRLLAAHKLLSVVGSRDTDVASHSTAVAHLAEGIGGALGLDEVEVEQLRIAGLLHDVGKIGVPDSILNKPGPLDPDEQELMKKHPELAFNLLDGHDLAPIDTWILHHHEHWDGKGYPDGLAGAEIPFGSRIVLVADAFEAMTTDRPYRPAISTEAAMQELRDHAGTQFDPLVVSALERHLAEQRHQSVTDSPVPAWSS
jgi:diguanylate cyclase (GGDEF)-like protein/putative nucleotidyltransferase with HDIG domain